MHFLLTIACLLSIVHVNGLRTVFFFDEATYNPCQTKSNQFFYAHPTDSHKYYQCDESGNAYVRSCGDLVWDDLRVTCNWASAVPPPPSKISPSETTSSWPTPTPSWPTPTSSWPTPTPSWPTPTPSWPTPTSSWPTSTASWPNPTSPWPTTTTTTESSWPSDASSAALCTPINPCGENGQCLESSITVPRSARRFACLCSENWFGRLCDKNVDDLTTPLTVASDQSKNASETIDTFLLPIETGKNSKYIFYGLASHPSGKINRRKRRNN